jgi:ribonucleotide reductase alpha subunit
MNSRTLLNKSIILSVFMFAGFLLARSLYYGSLVGAVCAVIAIAAWTIFLYRLSIAQAENEPAEEAENY